MSEQENIGSAFDLQAFWGKKKPWLFVLLAVQAAGGAEGVHEAVGWFRRAANAPEGLPDVPDLKTWLVLYRDHRRVADGLFSAVFAEIVPGVKASGALGDWRSFMRMGEEDRATEIQKMPPEVIAALASLFMPVDFPPSEDDLKAMLNGELFNMLIGGTEATDDEAGKRILAMPEMQFFMRVVMPCWSLYQECPTKIFHRARAGRRDGDTEDLENLLRLDKSILSDPVIGQRWHKLTHSGNKGQYTRLMAAMKGQPSGSSARKKTKERTAALISQLAIAMQCEVTSAEILGLFDRIAKIRTGYRDQHLPGGETLSKAIQRNRKFPWFQ